MAVFYSEIDSLYFFVFVCVSLHHNYTESVHSATLTHTQEENGTQQQL